MTFQEIERILKDIYSEYLISSNLNKDTLVFIFKGESVRFTTGGFLIQNPKSLLDKEAVRTYDGDCEITLDLNYNFTVAQTTNAIHIESDKHIILETDFKTNIVTDKCKTLYFFTTKDQNGDLESSKKAEEYAQKLGRFFTENRREAPTKTEVDKLEVDWIDVKEFEKSNRDLFVTYNNINHYIMEFAIGVQIDSNYKIVIRCNDVSLLTSRVGELCILEKDNQPRYEVHVTINPYDYPVVEIVNKAKILIRTTNRTMLAEIPEIVGITRSKNATRFIDSADKFYLRVYRTDECDLNYLNETKKWLDKLFEETRKIRPQTRDDYYERVQQKIQNIKNELR